MSVSKKGITWLIVPFNYANVKLFMDAAQLAKLKECDLIKRKYSQFPGICPCIPLGCLQHPTDPQLGCLRTKQIQAPVTNYKFT